MPVQRHLLRQARLHRQSIPGGAQRPEGVAPGFAQRGDDQRPKGGNADFDEQRGADRHWNAEARDPLQKAGKRKADHQDLQQLVRSRLLDPLPDDPERPGFPHYMIDENSRPDDNDDAQRAPGALERFHQYLLRDGAKAQQRDGNIDGHHNDGRPADAPLQLDQKEDEQQHRHSRQQAQDNLVQLIHSELRF